MKLKMSSLPVGKQMLISSHRKCPFLPVDGKISVLPVGNLMLICNVFPTCCYVHSTGWERNTHTYRQEILYGNAVIPIDKKRLLYMLRLPPSFVNSVSRKRLEIFL